MRLNWGAVLVAAIVHWLLGAFWFTTFAGPWAAGLRMTPDELQAAKAHPNFWPYLIALLCNFLLAYAIARLLIGSKSHTVFRGIRVGLLVGIATAVAMVTELVFRAAPTLVHRHRRRLSVGGVHCDGHHSRRLEAEGEG